MDQQSIEKFLGEVKVDDEIIRDKEKVLEKWKCDYEQLYKVTSETFNENYKKEVLRHDPVLETPTLGNADHLNRTLTPKEVRDAVNRTKTKKAPGLDNITNELIKNDEVTELLYRFYRKCFETKVLSDAWRQTLIHPIPKTKKIEIDPLKYRGLALQSCIFKVFSDILNSRLVLHLEENNIITDEQNGFRRSRSCSQHIYTLT